jgi:hypothetical protein
MNASITVYLQALGGKFLGPHAFETDKIELSLTYGGGEMPLAYQLGNNSDDGQINTVFTSGLTSFMPILTQQENNAPAVNYLTPDSETICATAGFEVDTLYETGMLKAAIPTPSGNPLRISQYLNLSLLQQNYRVVMVVPGLYLQPVPGAAGTTNISVLVTMMCGCRVTEGLATSFWAPADFNVHAELVFSNGSSQTIALAFNSTANDSSFTATVADAANIVQVNFTAVQQSTGNFGYLDVPWQ